jgi:hypothetical protein
LTDHAHRSRRSAHAPAVDAARTARVVRVVRVVSSVVSALCRAANSDSQKYSEKREPDRGPHGPISGLSSDTAQPEIRRHSRGERSPATIGNRFQSASNFNPTTEGIDCLHFPLESEPRNNEGRRVSRLSGLVGRVGAVVLTEIGTSPYAGRPGARPNAVRRTERR